MSIDDNNSDLEQLKIDRQLREQRRATASGGASISQVRDPRVTRLVSIGMVVASGSILAVGAWIGTTLVSIKENLATIAAQNYAFAEGLRRNDTKDDQQDAHINAVDSRVSVLEGRTFRGVPGYEPEAKRGH